MEETGRSAEHGRVLRVLTRSLEENTIAFEQRMARARIKHGINILPFDIVSKILASNRPTLKEAVELSHVSSHFRQAILSTPLIWANYALHPRMSSEQIVSLANRSGTRSLAARILPGLEIEDWDKRVEHILSFSTRLQTLVIENIDDNSALSLQVHYSNLRMPIIDSLSIDCSRFAFCVHFYASWSLQNVKRLEPVFGQHLSSCHIKFTQMFDVECLLHLKIELVDISEADIDGVIEEHAGVDISSITSFSFHVVGKTSIMFARRVLCTIFPPNAIEIFCEMEVDIWPQTNQSLLLFPVQKFTMLKTLNLQFSGPGYVYMLPLSTILHFVPSGLENVRLEAPHHILDLLHLGFLEDLQRNLLRKGVQLERLEIVGCRPLVEEKDIRGNFPSLEIVWAP
ncbi:hypothetical protein DFH11DRAFT_1640135 [Phellopilus nigrolimitatus]|nr:hypothetical protein DFH11DRAFT_1640135 [Phellopilus nigrolimitatus]